ncbi:MAG: SDR family NAD(P)-dependent oxidoreductase [Alphaproteobacteria bacterium]
MVFSNTILPAADIMRARPADAAGRRGQIAIMSSLASFRGFGYAPAYCASKAALRVFGEGLRAALAKAGISVSVICPGYIKTPMTAGNPFPMPLMMDVDRAARIIRRGLARRRGRIAFPWPMYVAVWLLAALPDRIADPLVRRIGY